jgi:hypothetical protein
MVMVVQLQDLHLIFLVAGASRFLLIESHRVLVLFNLLDLLQQVI